MYILIKLAGIPKNACKKQEKIFKRPKNCFEAQKNATKVLEEFFEAGKNQKTRNKLQSPEKKFLKLIKISKLEKHSSKL